MLRFLHVPMYQTQSKTHQMKLLLTVFYCTIHPLKKNSVITFKLKISLFVVTTQLHFDTTLSILPKAQEGQCKTVNPGSYPSWALHRYVFGNNIYANTSVNEVKHLSVMVDQFHWRMWVALCFVLVWWTDAKHMQHWKQTKKQLEKIRPSS